MNVSILGLDTADVAVLESLVNNLIALDVDIVKGRRLSHIASCIRRSILSATTGIWDHGRGDFTFSFYYSNNKVAAIKLLREATGLGLKEAKDIVDNAKAFLDGTNQLLIVNSTEEFFDDLCKRVRNYTGTGFGESGVELKASIKQLQ